MNLSPRIFSFRKKILPYLYFAASLRDDAIQWANEQVQEGIKGEKGNMPLQDTRDIVNMMNNPENHLLVTRQRFYSGYYHQKVVNTSLGYSVLVLSPFRSWSCGGPNNRQATDIQKDVIARLFPVGVNGFKKEIRRKYIKMYMEFNRQLLEYLVSRGQFFLFADCLTGPFNRKCANYLKQHFDICADRVFHTNKKHSRRYWKTMQVYAERVIEEFGFKETGAGYLRGYLKSESQWHSKDRKKIGRYAHKLGKVRHVPGMDLINIHTVPKELINKCKEYYELTGRKALVVLMDDSISSFGCTAKSVANQLGKYADIIIIATMFEF